MLTALASTSYPVGGSTATTSTGIGTYIWLYGQQLFRASIGLPVYIHSFQSSVVVNILSRDIGINPCPTNSLHVIFH